MQLTGRAASGGHSRLWAFGYADFARLLGLSESRLRRLVSLGELDLGDLEQVCQRWARRRRM